MCVCARAHAREGARVSCNLYWRAMRTLRALLSLLRSLISRRVSCILAIRVLSAPSDDTLEIFDLARGMAKAPILRPPAAASTNSSVSSACSVCSARYSRVVSSVLSVPPPPPPSCEPCSVAMLRLGGTSEESDAVSTTVSQQSRAVSARVS